MIRASILLLQILILLAQNPYNILYLEEYVINWQELSMDDFRLNYQLSALDSEYHHHIRFCCSWVYFDFKQTSNTRERRWRRPDNRGSMNSNDGSVDGSRNNRVNTVGNNNISCAVKTVGGVNHEDGMSSEGLTLGGGHVLSLEGTQIGFATLIRHILDNEGYETKPKRTFIMP